MELVEDLEARLVSASACYCCYKGPQQYRDTRSNDQLCLTTGNSGSSVFSQVALMCFDKPCAAPGYYLWLKMAHTRRYWWGPVFSYPRLFILYGNTRSRFGPPQTIHSTLRQYTTRDLLVYNFSESRHYSALSPLQWEVVSPSLPRT